MKKKILFILLCFVFFNVHAKENDNLITKRLGIYVIGDLIEYVNLYSDYIEKGASFYDDMGNDLSSSIKVSYFNHGRQISKMDTSSLNNYLVNYSIKYKGEKYEANRIVIALDTEKPVFGKFDNITITDLEAATFDVNSGVFASDNSSKVYVKCFNSLGFLPGNYSILCRAEDANGNVSTKRRLIKVVKSINFDYDDKLIINFPKGDNYIYKYSLDGEIFIECKRKETLDVSSGSVIAAVYLNDKIVTSNTYFIS